MKQLICLMMCAVAVSALAAGHVTLWGTYRSPLTGVYPGTEREVLVSVPDAYTGEQPACVFVGFDGVLCNAPAVFDSLMAAGTMPVTIGVYVQPGVLRKDDGTVLRYNRSVEFDATTGEMAAFLEQEVLPWVERMTTPDGRPVRLSHRAADRAVFGLSSGGIAALTAAWHRPHLFSRVFSGVGTFVAMRGGNLLQAIVRKHEPQPLRVFLQDGTADAWNPLFGHWYEGNRMLASALDFAGYETRYDWSDGGHNERRSTRIFAEVMTWLWSGWPAAPACGTTANDFLAPLLQGHPTGWRHTVITQSPPRRPCQALYPDGSLRAYYVEGHNRLWQQVTDLPASAEPFYWLHSYDNAPLQVGPMAFDANGNLWVVTSAGLQACDQNGRVRGILKLPPDVAASDVLTLDIANGRIILCTAALRYERALSIQPPVPGQRPGSQGQG